MDARILSYDGRGRSMDGRTGKGSGSTTSIEVGLGGASIEVSCPV